MKIFKGKEKKENKEKKVQEKKKKKKKENLNVGDVFILLSMTLFLSACFLIDMIFFLFACSGFTFVIGSLLVKKEVEKESDGE